MISFRRFLPVISAFSFVLPVAADTITGKVVDTNGIGVANVNIDAFEQSTGDPVTLMNDGTDANGCFTTTIPAGVYLIRFLPPPPPTTTHLVLDVPSVVVVGTKNMGTLVLPPGVSLGGHVQRSGGFPVPGVNIDLIDLVAKKQLVIQCDFTDSSGDFLIAVPANAIELRLDATPVPFPVLASTALQLSPTGNTTLPPITLQPGFDLSGTVEDENGDPVKDADIDVFDSTTSQEQYTPGDNTDDNGDFSVVVAAGTYDVEVCPDQGDLLVAEAVGPISVSSNTSVGLIVLEPGAVLSGTVRNSGGQPLANVDIDVDLAGTATSVVTCNDNTNGSGFYSVIVPFTTIDVRFTPNFSLPYGTAFSQNVVITGNRTLNATLPNCPFPTNYGTGLAGTGGIVPHITTSGGAPSVENEDFQIECQDARGGSLAILVLSLSPASIPALGGTILVNIGAGQHINVTTMTSGTPGAPGAGSFSFAFPSLAGAAGFAAYAQFGVRDPNAVRGWAMSEGLEMHFCN